MILCLKSSSQPLPGMSSSDIRSHSILLKIRILCDLMSEELIPGRGWGDSSGGEDISQEKTIEEKSER